MQVLVTKNQRGRPDNTGVYLYKAGKTYGAETVPPMPADLAEVFVREGWGEEVKALDGAPENKMLHGADENKGDGQGGAAADGEAAQSDVGDAPGQRDPLAARAEVLRGFTG